MKLPVFGGAVPRRGNLFTRMLGKGILHSLGWFGWRLEGDLHNLPKCMIIAAPHTTNWDFVLAMAVLFATGLKVSWMGKKSIFKWPFAGVFRWMGGIPIDRNVRHGVVEQTIETFKSRDQLIIGIAPEGTRKIKERWKTGFYHMAFGAGVPIVLAYLNYGQKRMGFGPKLIPSGDFASDMAQINAFYADKMGKNPDQFALHHIAPTQ
jgi:1-acyl-sn-glycerol-3-phosphate acyltransferase